MNSSFENEEPILGNKRLEEQLKNPNTPIGKIHAAEQAEQEEKEKNIVLDTIYFLQQKQLKEKLEELSDRFKQEAQDEKKKQEGYQKDYKQGKDKELKYQEQYYEQRSKLDNDRIISLLNTIITNIGSLYSTYEVLQKENEKLNQNWRQSEKKQATNIVKSLNFSDPIKMDDGKEVQLQLFSNDIEKSVQEKNELLNKLSNHATPQKIKEVVRQDIPEEHIAKQGGVLREIEIFDFFRKQLELNHSNLIKQYGASRLYFSFSKNNPSLKTALTNWVGEMQKYGKQFNDHQEKEVDFFNQNQDKIQSIQNSLNGLNEASVENEHTKKLNLQFDVLASRLGEAVEKDKQRTKTFTHKPELTLTPKPKVKNEDVVDHNEKKWRP